MKTALLLSLALSLASFGMPFPIAASAATGLRPIAALSAVSHDIQGRSASAHTLIHVAGDHGTDLDFFLYNANGDLVASDTSDGDDSILSVPAWENEDLTLVVINRGPLTNHCEISVLP